MQPGLVSIMMPAYNAAQYVALAIRSVMAQSYPKWELIVVNDGSTDATPDIVREFDDPRIRLLNKENGGESTARNMALDHSRGEYIAYLDADDLYLPHHLAVTVGFLETHPDREAVYTDGYHIDEHGRRLTSLQSRRRGPFEGRLFEQVVRASDVFGPPMCVVFRHRVAIAHQLRYDPRIVIGPDWDFFARLADAATFGYLADATGLYRVHQTNITAKVDPSRRAGYLAICRENAIRLASFGSCSAGTRAEVFYDLLVDLLRGQPDRRAEVLAWPQFAELPPSEQARLLRLTASAALLLDARQDHVAEWLERACAVDAADRRAKTLLTLYRVSPRLCAAVLRARSRKQRLADRPAPFADLQKAFEA